MPRRRKCRDRSTLGKGEGRRGEMGDKWEGGKGDRGGLEGGEEGRWEGHRRKG